MIRFEILRPPEDLVLSLEAGEGASTLEMPFSAALYFAENCQTGDVLVWQEPEAGLVGFISANARREWSLSSIRLVQIVCMQPGVRPGVVGIEIGVDEAEEEPVLAFEEYSREALDWLKDHRSVLVECLGVEIPVVDYGRDG